MKKYFENCRIRIHKIRAALNSAENETRYDKQLSRQNDEDRRKLDTKRIENETIEVTAKKIEANAKWHEIGLKHWRWILSVIVMAPILLRIFAWTSKLPYPRF